MNVTCFPIAARPYSAESNNDSLGDLGLIGELADEVINLFRRAPKQLQPAQPPNPIRQMHQCAQVLPQAQVWPMAPAQSQTLAQVQAQAQALAQAMVQAQPQAPHPMSETERAFLAKSTNTPVSILERLSHDQSTSVRNELIFNPAVPQHVLKNLAGDPDRFIAGQARAKLADAA